MTGGNGMLGQDLVSELVRRGNDVVAPRSIEFDVTNPESAATIATKQYGELDAVINCAAYTAVDQAESYLDRAYGVNALGPGLLARACSMAGVRLIQISTDYVFDGKQGEPYVESDNTNPLGIYGKSKRDGEEAVRAGLNDHVILRTSWLFGPNGKSFPRTMIQAAKAGKSLRVVDDQFGTPTYTGDLAKVIVDMIEKKIDPGTYHAAGPKVTTWYLFAAQALATAGIEADIEGISTEDWPTPAPRPRYSALNCEKLAAMGIEITRPLKESLKEFLARLPEEG